MWFANGVASVGTVIAVVRVLGAEVASAAGRVRRQGHICAPRVLPVEQSKSPALWAGWSSAWSWCSAIKMPVSGRAVAVVPAPLPSSALGLFPRGGSRAISGLRRSDYVRSAID